MSTDLVERVQRVRLLLETLNDPYPTPRSALAPESGPAASKFVPCETCGRRGEVRTRAGWRLCLVCDGTGEKRRQGEPEWDAYLQLPLEEAMELPVETHARYPLDPKTLEQTYSWERRLRTQDRHGSYPAIRRALQHLSVVHPYRYRLVNRVLVEHHPVKLAPAARAALDLGVLTITLRVGKVRVPPWLIEQTAGDERRSTIALLVADGYSAGQIARRLGLSKRAVQRRLRS